VFNSRIPPSARDFLFADRTLDPVTVNIAGIEISHKPDVWLMAEIRHPAYPATIKIPRKAGLSEFRLREETPYSNRGSVL
jgi:hypothetical protein